jgi:hypothetical protein
MQPHRDHIAVDPVFGVGVPPRQLVTFADGTDVWLNRVVTDGSPNLFRRHVVPVQAERIEDMEPFTVDLVDLVPDLRTDLPIASTRDVPGIVHYSLRLRFKSAGDFVREARGRLQ